MLKLIVFLGNHGRQYRNTRHNVAWLFLDYWLDRLSAPAWRRGFKGSWAELSSPQGKLWLLKPETYMNLSGSSVAELAGFYKVAPEEILAVHDDLELPFGSYGIKSGGGLGGHNGLRSMKASLGTADYQRLRIGIGRPDHTDISAYVLSDFSRAEAQDLDCAVFPACVRALDCCLSTGLETALRDYRKCQALS